jgi:polyhydroxyalkanoate synthesis repressor PhaR
MSQTRVIKKYPNRRLYDTEESRYITLADIRRLVLENVSFSVVDQKSGDDITRTILLQVISEQEENGEPIMTADFLAQMIRAYHRTVPQFIGKYLEQSLGLFLRQQQEVRQQVASVMGMDPMAPVREAARQNWNRWIEMQQDVMRAFMGQSLGGADGDGGNGAGPRTHARPDPDAAGGSPRAKGDTGGTHDARPQGDGPVDPATGDKPLTAPGSQGSSPRSSGSGH